MAAEEDAATDFAKNKIPMPSKKPTTWITTLNQTEYLNDKLSPYLCLITKHWTNPLIRLTSIIKIEIITHIIYIKIAKIVFEWSSSRVWVPSL